LRLRRQGLDACDSPAWGRENRGYMTGGWGMRKRRLRRCGIFLGWLVTVRWEALRRGADFLAAGRILTGAWMGYEGGCDTV